MQLEQKINAYFPQSYCNKHLP